MNVRHRARVGDGDVGVLQDRGLHLGLTHLGNTFGQREVGDLHVGLPALEHVVRRKPRHEADGPRGNLGAKVGALGVLLGHAVQERLPCIGEIGDLHRREGERATALVADAFDQFEFLQQRVLFSSEFLEFSDGARRNELENP